MDGVDRLHWNLARALFGVTVVCSTAGVIGNSLIFLTTIRTKSLRATYNILIAVCAIADVFHQCGTLVQLPMLFDWFLLIDSQLCGYIMFLPEMGIAIGCMCILCIGLDRMFSVLFSTRYRVLNKPYYHTILGSMIAAYCAFLCYLMIAFARKRAVVCEILAPYADEGVVWFTGSNLLVNGASSTVYFITWLGLRSHSDSKAMKRIIRSLFIIVVADVSGWILTPGLIKLSSHLELEPQQQFVWLHFSIIFINLALSIKILIYYSTSSEYRTFFENPERLCS